MTETTGSLFRPLYSLCKHRGAAYPEEPGEAPSRGKAPSWKSSPGCDLDYRSGIDAGEVANAHQHTYVLRSQPHRRVGALVDAIQEQQPPDCSSQRVNHGRRRADAIALTSTPSKRRLLNGVAVWIVRGDFASPAASSPSTQLTRRFARRRRRSPSPSKSSTP